MKRTTAWIFLPLVLLIVYSCQRTCMDNYVGNWQFTTNFSTNSQAPHKTEVYTGQIRILSFDSMFVDCHQNWDYSLKANCVQGTLGGDMYQGNHGWGYYTGTLGASTFECMMVRCGGFPPYDTTYQVIRGVKL